MNKRKPCRTLVGNSCLRFRLPVRLSQPYNSESTVRKRTWFRRKYSKDKSKIEYGISATGEGPGRGRGCAEGGCDLACGGFFNNFWTMYAPPGHVSYEVASCINGFIFLCVLRSLSMERARVH
ncbi:hypothetical protein EVAR_14428_1 [Eumeta japonica]|uniref:Uncharacterized protein n=1 Tax=Eumeta variegata TaxID=151549 RepID=A0A4C1TXK4_EUMVA|nr:hypothetical protein EVAR_14428_1 [Eumeta japonica]